MSDGNWYDQPMDDNWSDVSNLEGYDSEGNWTGQGSNGQSIFQNNYGNSGIPNMEDDPMNYTWGKETLPGYDNSGNWINDSTVKSGGQSIFGPQQQNFAPRQPQEDSQDFLSRLFQNPGGLLKLGGALMSGDQNKKKVPEYGQIARDPRLDPFGSQRGHYQQMASDFATTPTNNPVYQNIQAETMRKLQMQAAATGRRTNPTDVMARLQAAMMPQYNDTLRNYANLGGSQFGPQGSTIADMLAKSANAKIEGYASPVMNALGNLFKNDELDQGKQQAAAALSKYLNGV